MEQEDLYKEFYKRFEPQFLAFFGKRIYDEYPEKFTLRSPYMEVFERDGIEFTF